MLIFELNKRNFELTVSNGVKKKFPSRNLNEVTEYCYLKLKEHMIATAERLLYQRENTFKHSNQNKFIIDKIAWCENIKWKIIECNPYINKSSLNDYFSKYFQYVLETISYIYPAPDSRFFTGFRALYNDLHDTLKHYFIQKNEVLKTNEKVTVEQLNLFD